MSRAIVAALVLISAMVAGSAWLLLGTTVGASWLIGVGQQRIPGELAVEELRGSLLDGLAADSVVYRDDGLVVRLEDVLLDGDVAALARRNLVVRKLNAASVTFNELPVALQASAAGSMRINADMLVDVRLQWQQIDGDARGKGSFVGPLNLVSFAHELELPDLVEISGTIENLVAAPAIDAIATWEKIALPQQDFGALVSRDGRLSVDGTIDAYRANVTTELIRDGEQRLLATLVAHGSAEELTVDSLDLEGLGARLLATGTVGFAEPPVVELSVTGSEFDPSILFPAFDGRLNFDGRIEARWPQRFVLDLARLSGEFRGVPVGGSAEMLAADGALRSASARLQAGANRLNLQFTGGERLGGEFEVDAPELGGLWPGLAGSLAGSGTVTGSLDAPRLQLSVVGSELSLDGQRIERLEVAAAIDDSGAVDADLRADDLRVAGQSLGDLRLLATGTLEAHELDVGLSGGLVSTSFRTSGSYDGQLLTQVLEAAAVETDVGDWTLREAATATVSSDSARLSAHCWDSGGASACVGDIEYVGERLAAGLELERFPLRALDPWLGEDLQLDGEADATLALESGPESLDLNLSWRQADTRIIFLAGADMFDDPDVETRLSSVELRVTADETAARLTGSVAGEFGLAAAIELSTENPLADDGPLAGTLTAEIPDIGELRPLIDRYVVTDGLAGELVVDISVGGTRVEPKLDGRARLADGGATLPALGIDVRDVELAVSAGERDTLALVGSARSGDGRLDFAGTIGASPDTGLFAEIEVTGEDFQLVRLPDQLVLISPDLTARFDEGQIRVDGKLLVPKAAFTFRELGDAAVATSPDVVIHREDSRSDDVQTRSRLAGQLNIELGDDVTFSGLEIATRLTGGILLTLRPNAPPAGEGALQLADGTFNALGREMTIERGSLNFYGPLDDPVVDARASRRVRYEGDSVKIGIQLSGRLSEKLDFVLFSEPAMSENDVLSFMVVGRPASTGQGDEGAMSGAALALGLQSLSATRRAGETLTLDEIGFEGGGEGDTAVVAGKRLNDKWYIRYSYGLFDRIGTFIIRYELGRGFSVEAGSGAQQSLDLIYSIDR